MAPPNLSRQTGRRALLVAVCLLLLFVRAKAQNRGVYPLGMSATNSGLMPESSFTYTNQLLFYSRNQAKDDNGNTLPITGNNSVLMDLNTLTWVSQKRLLRGARYSAAATLPFAKNDLTTDIHGNISGGNGFADSYYLPCILGWNSAAPVRIMYGFLAPTGRFAAGANNNVGSGYWTHALSSGQTFYLSRSKLLALSAFEMYEFHTTQEGSGIHPGQTFDLDYSLLGSLPRPGNLRLQVGLVGYVARQTTAKSGPGVTLALSEERYHVNAIGFAFAGAFPTHKASLSLKYFQEFANRATFQGYSLQVAGAISF